MPSRISHHRAVALFEMPARRARCSYLVPREDDNANMTITGRTVAGEIFLAGSTEKGATGSVEGRRKLFWPRRSMSRVFFSRPSVKNGLGPTPPPPTTALR